MVGRRSRPPVLQGDPKGFERQLLSELKIPPPCPIQSPNRHNFISAMRMRPSCLPVIMACITRARATHCSSSHQHSRRLWSRWCLPPSLLLGLCVHRRLEWAWIGNELERLNVAQRSAGGYVNRITELGNRFLFRSAG